MAAEQDEGGTPLIGAHRLILLAGSYQAGETDRSFCERASATAATQSLLVVNGHAKLISGQDAQLLTGGEQGVRVCSEM
jgi:hypothetical protein